MKHIFLTGEIQVGKSTILNKIIAAHPDKRIGGFRTVWQGDRFAPDSSGFHIVPAAGNVPLTAENCVGVRRGIYPNRIAEDYPEIYDKAGTSLLRNAKSYDLILMDEVGKGENEARLFQRAVLDTLDGDTPVVGVVRNQPGVLTDAVRAHPKVKVIVVTVENRDSIASMLVDAR